MILLFRRCIRYKNSVPTTCSHWFKSSRLPFCKFEARSKLALRPRDIGSSILLCVCIYLQMHIYLYIFIYIVSEMTKVCNIRNDTSTVYGINTSQVTLALLMFQLLNALFHSFDCLFLSKP